MTRLLASLTIVLATSVALPQDAPPPTDRQRHPDSKQRPADVVAEDEQHLLELLRQRDEKIEELERRLAAIERQLQELQEAAAEVPTEEAASAEEELAELRRLAEAEAVKEEEEKATEEETTFKARGLSLQALNPEISVTGDMYGFYRHQQQTRQRSGFEFRNLGLHLESYLDPYTRFKAAVEIHEEGAELGEAYMTRYGLLEGVNLTFGKFRQQFGVVNRWHKHGLDQFDFPLALRQVFGDGGLNQIGISLDWVLPQIGGTSQELTVQLTNGQNPRLFSGNTLGTPSLLLHYKNYRDLSKDTYLELGLTGLGGFRDEWEEMAGGEIVTIHDSQPAFVYGVDLTMLWEPTGRMRYRNLVWRSELYVLSRDIVAPDGSGADTLDAWGGYSYVQSKMNRKLDLGFRLDYYRPDTKSYAAFGSWLNPHAFDHRVTQWLVAPYVTWQQSPWVKWRIEYNHLDLGDIVDPADTIYLQLIFAAGPHKHERY
jgi:hypothetical protein